MANESDNAFSLAATLTVFPLPALPTNITGFCLAISKSMKNLMRVVSDVDTRQDWNKTILYNNWKFIFHTFTVTIHYVTCNGISGSNSNDSTLSPQGKNFFVSGSIKKLKTLPVEGNLICLNSLQNHLLNSFRQSTSWSWNKPEPKPQTTANTKYISYLKGLYY